MNQENIRKIAHITRSESLNFTTLIDVALSLDEKKIQTLKEYMNLTDEAFEKYQETKWDAINSTINIIGADSFTEYYYYFVDGLYDRNRINLYNMIQDKDKLLKKLYIYTAAKFDAVVPIFIKGKPECRNQNVVSDVCVRQWVKMLLQIYLLMLLLVFGK